MIGHVFAAILLGVVSSKPLVATNSTGAVSNAFANVRWSQVPETNVVLVIDGKAMTKSEIDRQVDYQVEMVKLRRKVNPKKMQAMRQEFLSRMAFEWTVRHYLANRFTEGNVIAPEKREAKQKRFLKTFGKKKSSYSDFEKNLKDNGLYDQYCEQVESELRFESVLQNSYSNELAVTKAEFDEMNRRIDDFLAMTMATNAIHYAAASNALARLERGEDFARVADECSEDPEKEKGGDYGEKDANEFTHEPEAYQKAVAALKDGEHTGILETEEGLEIVKMIRRVPADETNSEAEGWHLARIFFRRALQPRRETPDELMREMQKDKYIKTLRAVQKKAEAGGAIVFPLGKGIFGKL